MNTGLVNSVNVWPNMIHKCHYDGDLSAAIAKAIKICKEEPDFPLELGGGKSSVRYHEKPHEWPELDEFTTWVSLRLEECWADWGMRMVPRYPINSWVNWHPKGAWTEEHDHGAIHQVMVLYLKKPKNSGNIQFRNPMQYHWASYPKNFNLSSIWQTVEVEEGDVLMFPGWISHRTEPNTSDDDRVVMTLNLSINKA